MEGTVIITGATGSLAIEAVHQLISSHPSLTVIGTVRNSSKLPKSSYLLRLEELVNKYPARLLLKSVDLNSLAEVRSFANEIAGQVGAGKLPPISAIICNAFTWSLQDGQKFSHDKYDSTFQVNHLAHYLLVLKLLGSMDRERGRIVMLGSEVHDPELRNPLSKLGAQLPSSSQLDQLISPSADPVGAEHDMGWRRYANSKLANVMFMHNLNKRLQQSPSLAKITVTAMDPGGLTDSRAHQAQNPTNRFLFRVLNFLLPVLKLFTDTFRSNADSARDLVALALGSEFQSARGYFNGKSPKESAAASQDTDAIKALWDACWKWADMKEGETCL